MSHILFQYEYINPSTWVYLSSLLIIGLFFKFGRLWSVRNLDIILLILLGPGLLMVHFGRANALLEHYRPELQTAAATAPPTSPADEDPPPESEGGITSPAPPPPARWNGRSTQLFGHLWLFCVAVIWLIRLLIDATMVRRPLLEPNLSPGGMAFIGCSLFVFLMANVVNGNHINDGIFAATLDRLKKPTKAPDKPKQPKSSQSQTDPGDPPSPSQVPEPDNRQSSDSQSPEASPEARTVNIERQLPAALRLPETPTAEKIAAGEERRRQRAMSLPGGPGYAPLALLPAVHVLPPPLIPPDAASLAQHRLAQTLAILAQLAIVLGMAAVGYFHCHNLKMGVGAATLYLMIPYTAQMTGHVEHTLPAAFLVWAVVSYRRPLTAGILLGLASMVYYPLFLLPLWCSFYWQRGLARFLVGILSTLLLMVLSLYAWSTDVAHYGTLIMKLFGIMFPRPAGLGGIWGILSGWQPYRYSLLTGFAVMSASFALWPAQKNLGTLMSCSAAIMFATQFWHGEGGGLFMAWYLPLTLMTVFRPNLEDRVAVAVLGEGWLPRRPIGATSL